MSIKSRILIVLLWMLPMSALGSSASDSIRSALSRMMDEYPSATLLDIYKSSFQNRYGPGHIVADVDRAKNYLDWELQQQFKRDNALYEPTLPDGRFYRVNLAVITDSIIDYDLFFNAFIDSVKDVEGPEIEAWAADWSIILDVVEAMGLDLPNYEADKAAIKGRLDEGIYQGEHSRRYVEAYDPHYRLIRRDIFEQRLKPQLDIHLYLTTIVR